MQVITQGLGDIGRALRDTLRVLGAHWPMLLVLFFAGAALRGGFLWLSVEASEFSGLLAMLLLPLASVSMLVSIVLMLRVAGRSFPTLQAELSDSPRIRFRTDLRLAVQTLIPFLALYAAQGMMREDLRLFFYNATADEWMNQGFNANFNRVEFTTDAVLIGIVIAALVLRKVIAGFNLGAKHFSIASFAGYLEALWLVTLASFFAYSLGTLREWLLDRRVTQAFLDGFDAMLARILSDTAAFYSGVADVAGWFGTFGALVVVPVSWIAVGATVYGASIPAAKPLLTSEQATKRLRRIPSPLKRGVAQLTEPVVTPFANTLKAISRIAVAGIVPMVLLCVLFALASQVRVLVTQGMRLLIGPHDSGFWFMATPYVELAASAVYTTLMVALLAAIVNVVVASTRRAQAQLDAEAAEEEAAAAESAAADAAASAFAADHAMGAAGSPSGHEPGANRAAMAGAVAADAADARASAEAARGAGPGQAPFASPPDAAPAAPQPGEDSGGHPFVPPPPPPAR